MAILINNSSGNLMTPATWGTAEAGAASQQTAISASTDTTASYVASAAFTVTNLDVIVGVLLHCKRVNETGTVTIGLSDDGGATWAREVTVNASDLPASQSWCFFKFGSTLTGDGGADYRVGIKGSSAGNATFYRDATAGNWARLLMTNTAPGSVAAGDALYIVGDLTGAGTGNNYTVTMDDTASTDFGAITVCHRGTLQFGTTAATNYTLKLSADLTVWAGGVLNQGTVATPMPGTSTGFILFDCTVNVEFGLLVKDGGTYVAQGASKTYDRCFLNADAAANATSLTTDVSTGWADNDKIAIASTTRTAAECEQGQLNGAASGTTLTVDGFGGVAGGLAYAHSGTSPTQAEIINLTRNVGVYGASASLQTYVNIAALATVDWDWGEFYWLGSGTANKKGIEIFTTTGSCDIQRCAVHDFIVAGSIGLNVSGGASNNFTIGNNCFYNCQTNCVALAGTTGTSWTVSGNVAIRWPAASYGFFMSAMGGTFTNNVAAGGGSVGFYLSGTAWGTVNNLTTHSNSAGGIVISAPKIGLELSDVTIWRNTSSAGEGGLKITGGVVDGVVITNLTIFGNDTTGLNLYGIMVYGLRLVNAVLSGDSSFSTAYGISFGGAGSLFHRLVLENCRLGVATGIKTAHTSADIGVSTANLLEITARNTSLASSTPIDMTGDRAGSYLRVQKFGQTAGDHRSWFLDGRIKTDSVIFKAASPSERIMPSSAALKRESGPKGAAVANLGTVTFSVWVRKSAVGDAGGADYNGNQPRLVVKKNVAAGIAADTVLDTMVVAVGTWEQLSGITAAVTDDAALKAVVDCDGTAGWVNVDDWSAS